MVTSEQRGFTLVETVIVMAVSSLLLIIAIAGFSTARAQSEFTQSVDGAKENLSQMKSAAEASVNDTGTRTSLCTVTLGQRADYVVNSSTVNLSLLRTGNTSMASCAVGANPPVTAVTADPPSYQMKWGLKYIGYSLGNPGVLVPHNYHVYYTRSLIDAHTQVWASTLVSPLSYNQVAAGLSSPVNLWFLTPDNKRAYVSVSTTGGISRIVP